MSQASAGIDRKRTGSLWCGWISLIGVGLPLLFLLLVQLTVTGAGAMVGVLPLFALWLTWWLWLGLAFVAFLLALQSRRIIAPLVVSVAALVGSIIGAVNGLQLQV